MVLATTPGAETVVAGLPLAVRAVLALREAGYEDVGLIVPDRPRWATEPLARRGASVRWVAPPPGGDLIPLVTGTPQSFSSPATCWWMPRPWPCSATRARGRYARPPARSSGRYDRTGMRRRAWPVPARRCGGTGPGTRILAGLAVSLAEAGSPRRLERALLDHLADRASNDSYLAALFDRPMSRPLTRLLLRAPLTPSHVTLLGVAIGLLGAAGLATVSYWGRLSGVLLLIAVPRARLRRRRPRPGAPGAESHRALAWTSSGTIS